MVEPIPTYVTAQIPEEIQKQVHDEVVQALHDAAATAGGQIRTVVAHGVPGTVIVEYAAKENCDCVVVASHRPALRDYLLGSTAARVVRHAGCTVHVMR